MKKNELKILISESIKRQLLNEGDSRLNKVMRIISDEFSGLLDLNGTVTYSEYYVNNNPNTTWGQYLLYSLRHNFGLMTNNDVKYLPFIAKIAFSDEVGFEKRNNNGEQLNTLRDIVQALKKDPELFNNLVNKGVDTYSELVEIMTPYLQAKEQEELNNINNKEYTHNTDYDIIEIHNYKEAHKIGEYSSLQDGRSNLCYTKSKSTWEQYTNNGNNRVFCLLKHGWNEMKPIAGENAPYDEYGLSMIFIFFNKMGKITTCNTRWNHEHSEWLHSGMSVDNSLSAEELSEIIGGNIYEVLGINRLEVTFDNVQELLDKGYKPDDIFDYVGKFIDGYAYVKLNVKWNFINTEGKILSNDIWFDSVWNFYDGYAKVKLNNKFNFIKSNGDILSPDQWFDEIYRFYNGSAIVVLNNKSNWIDTNGNYLSEQWYDYIDSFYFGHAVVSLNNKFNFVDRYFHLVSPNQWFDEVDDFDKNGYSEVKIGDTWYKIDMNGQLYDKDTMQPINRQNSTNITLNELKHIIRESIKRKLNNL